MLSLQDMSTCDPQWGTVIIPAAAGDSIREAYSGAQELAPRPMIISQAIKLFLKVQIVNILSLEHLDSDEITQLCICS